MGLSESEKTKLQAFANISLSKTQTEVIIDRTLTNSEWKLLNKNYKKIFAQVAKQSANVAKQKRHNLSQTYPPTPNLIETASRNELYIRKNIRKRRSDLRNQNEQEVDLYTYMRSLHKPNKNDYGIKFISQRYVKKYRTTISSWKINGDINLFNVNRAINDLIQKITKGKPENVRMQIVLKAPDGKEPDTRLLPKKDIIKMLTQWVNYLIDYKDFNISDITFQVTSIEIPAGGTGQRC